MRVSKPRVVDLFAGCGGLSLGAARAGFEVVGAIDFDSRALATHALNFPNTAHSAIDLSTATSDDVRNTLGIQNAPLDGVVGGPPCQGYSSIGRRDVADPRNKLFSHFFRLVAGLSPDFFVCENVPGILSKSYRRMRSIAFKQIESDYELLPPIRLNAKDFGAPTDRTRIVFVGYRKDIPIKLSPASFTPPADIESVTVAQALRGLPVRIDSDWQNNPAKLVRVGPSYNGEFGRRLNGLVPKGVGNSEALQRLRLDGLVSGSIGTKHTESVLQRWRNLPPGKTDKISRCPRLDPNGFCPTIRAGTGKDRGSYQAIRPIHPTEDRVITPREAARLQGFPDWFQFDETKWHSFRQIGNSVSPILAERVFELLGIMYREASNNLEGSDFYGR